MIRLYTLLCAAIFTLCSCQNQPKEIQINIDSHQNVSRAIHATVEYNSQNAAAIAIKKMVKSELPQTMQTQFNNIQQILHWEENTDKSRTKYIAILAYVAKDNTADIQCAIYKNNGTEEYQEEWIYNSDAPLKVADAEQIEFTKNQFLITDLDNNSKPELWIGYTLQCPITKEFKKELCVVIENKLDKFNPSKNSLTMTTSQDIVDFAKNLWN